MSVDYINDREGMERQMDISTRILSEREGTSIGVERGQQAYRWRAKLNAEEKAKFDKELNKEEE